MPINAEVPFAFLHEDKTKRRNSGSDRSQTPTKICATSNMGFKNLKILLLAVLVATIARESAAQQLDFYVLALEWGGYICTVQDCVIPKYNTFTIHGLWPSGNDPNNLPEYCDGDDFNVDDLSDLLDDLNNYWPDIESGDNPTFWSDEWDRHGKCAIALDSNNFSDQYDYFDQSLTLDGQYGVMSVLADNDITPSEDTFYRAADLSSALAGEFGSQIAMECDFNSFDKQALKEVYICFDTDLNTIDCPTAFTDNIDECKGSDLLYFPSFYTVLKANSLPATFYQATALAMLLTGICAGIGIYAVVLCIIRARKISWRELHYFTTREPKVVRWPGLTEPCRIECMQLIPEQVPVFSQFLIDLPIGMGIKGGIARKILKLILGVPKDAPYLVNEMGGDYDIDVCVFVDKATKQTASYARKNLTGVWVGGMALEAKDIEVLDEFYNYFRTRDVTQNEVLIFRESEDSVTLYYTPECKMDCFHGYIRCPVRSLITTYHPSWMCAEDGTPVIGRKQLARAIVRMMKGHGSKYLIDDATWNYYKRVKLGPIGTFQVLRNFEKPAKFTAAYKHLLELGVVDPTKNPYEVWGEALWLINHKMSRYGLKFGISPQSPEQVDIWCETKKQEMSEWVLGRHTFAQKTGFIECNEEAEIILPDKLKNFNRYMYNHDDLKPWKAANTQRQSILLEPGVLDDEAKFQTKVARKHNMEKFKEFITAGNTDTAKEDIPQAQIQHSASQAAGNVTVTAGSDRLAPKPQDDGIELKEIGNSSKNKEFDMDKTIRNINVKTIPARLMLYLILRVLALCNRYKFIYLVAIIVLFVQIIIRIILAQLEGKIVDSFIATQLFYVTMASIGEILSVWISGTLLKVFAVKTIMEFLKKVFRHIILLTKEEEDKMHVADKIARLPEVMSLKGILATDIPQYVEGLFQAAACTIAALYLDLSLGIYLLVPVAANVISGIVYTFLGRYRFRYIRKNVQRIYRRVHDTFDRARGIYNLHAEEQEIQTYNRLLHRVYNMTRTINIIHAAFSCLNLLGGYAAHVLILWVGSEQVLNGQTNIGSVFTILFLASLASQGITQMHMSWSTMINIIGNSERVFDLLRKKVINKASLIELAQEVDGKVDFKDVSFAYPTNPKEPIFNNLSFTATKGKMLVITGPPGSGKSTVANLIQGLYPPTAGEIWIDSNNLKNLDNMWKEKLGTITQEPEFFNTSIANNIAYGSHDATMDRITRAAKVAGAQEFIEKLQDGYSSIIGEFGCQLSESEKQKIVLARVLVGEPRIIVADEPTAHLDEESEAQAIDVFKKLKKNCTLIITTKSPAVIAAADEVVYFKL